MTIACKRIDREYAQLKLFPPTAPSAPSEGVREALKRAESWLWHAQNDLRNAGMIAEAERAMEGVTEIRAALATEESEEPPSTGAFLLSQTT